MAGRFSSPRRCPRSGSRSQRMLAAAVALVGEHRMATVNVLVLRAPGTNCDEEACYAFERVAGRPNRVHVNALLESPCMLHDYQVLVLPGGFAYGDDVAAGKILANQLRLRLADQLRE